MQLFRIKANLLMAPTRGEYVLQVIRIRSMRIARWFFFFRVEIFKSWKGAKKMNTVHFRQNQCFFGSSFWIWSSKVPTSCVVGCTFLASQNALEVTSVSERVRVQIETLLMSPWWVRIPTRNLTDVKLKRVKKLKSEEGEYHLKDEDGEDDEDEYQVTKVTEV